MPVDSLYYQAEQVGPAADAEVLEPEPENDTDRLWRVVNAMRNGQGQWQKGISGNPAGRPRGSRNRATLLAEAMLDASNAIVMGKTIEKAIAGDGVNQRFLLARVLPVRRSAPVELDLPPLDTQKDIALAVAAVGKAVAAGEVTPAEAIELAKLFETAMRAVDKREHEYWAHYPCGTRPPAAPPVPGAEPDPPQGDTAAAETAESSAG